MRNPDLQPAGSAGLPPSCFFQENRVPEDMTGWDGDWKAFVTGNVADIRCGTGHSPSELSPAEISVPALSRSSSRCYVCMLDDEVPGMTHVGDVYLLIRRFSCGLAVLIPQTLNPAKLIRAAEELLEAYPVLGARLARKLVLLLCPSSAQALSAV